MKIICLRKFAHYITFLMLLACYNNVEAQSSPQTTNQVLKEASDQAARENKKVFVIFHASWCSWCHRMDSIMNTADCKELFASNYVIKHLVVFESKNKKELENPGAMDLLTKYHGDKEGIPFWLIFDKDGKLLADSQIRPDGSGLEVPGKNTGCPNTPGEVVHFIEVLKKTSSLNTNQLATIEQSFKKK